MRLIRSSAIAILLLGLSVPTIASAQTGGLSEAERIILGTVLKDVLGQPQGSGVGDAVIIDERDDDDDRDDKNKAKGKGKGNGLPPGLAKKDTLPPGLAKRDSLPPGLAKRLERELPDRDVEVTDDDVIIRDKQTGAIVQIIRDILNDSTATSQ